MTYSSPCEAPACASALPFPSHSAQDSLFKTQLHGALLKQRATVFWFPLWARVETCLIKRYYFKGHEAKHTFGELKNNPFKTS